MFVFSDEIVHLFTEQKLADRLVSYVVYQKQTSKADSGGQKLVLAGRSEVLAGSTDGLTDKQMIAQSFHGSN